MAGFDAEMAHRLAIQLGVRLEFVPVTRDSRTRDLNTGVCDIVMAGVRMAPSRAEVLAFSVPYAEETPAFLVEDRRRGEFADMERLRGRGVRIGIMAVPEWVGALRRTLPEAEIVPLTSISQFLDRRPDSLDAMLTTWERASFWSLLHPELAAVLPRPRPGHLVLAYALPMGEPDLMGVVNTWIESSRAAGQFESARNYWILGQALQETKPRWSIARDVLGWGR